MVDSHGVGQLENHSGIESAVRRIPAVDVDQDIQ